MSIVRLPASGGMRWGLSALFVAAACMLGAPASLARAQAFTIEQALSAPFTEHLTRPRPPRGGWRGWPTSAAGATCGWLSRR